MDSNTTTDIDGPCIKQASVLSKRFWIIPWPLAYNRLELDCIRKIINFWYTFGWKWRVFVTIYDCRTHVRMTSMTSSVERTDLNFKISVALVCTAKHETLNSTQFFRDLKQRSGWSKWFFWMTPSVHLPEWSKISLQDSALFSFLCFSVATVSRKQTTQRHWADYTDVQADLCLCCLHRT